MDTLQLLVLWVCVARAGSSYCSKEDGANCGEKGSKNSLYEEQVLARRKSGRIGQIVKEDLGDGKMQTVTTRAVNPPIFELPHFLSDEECDYIRTKAKKHGLAKGNTVQRTRNGGVAIKSGDMKTTFFDGKKDKTLRKIMDRASVLMGLPKQLIYDSENFLVKQYTAGGSHGFHHDSSNTTEETIFKIPCCHQTPGPIVTEKCSLCRYATILMYLNNVEEGGETAFPLADSRERTVDNTPEHFELLCDNSPVLISPVKGNAVLWYNNIVDPVHGWLGAMDERSIHAGCSVIRGEKWVSKLWINAPYYNSQHIKSTYH